MLSCNAEVMPLRLVQTIYRDWDYGSEHKPRAPQFMARKRWVSGRWPTTVQLIHRPADN